MPGPAPSSPRHRALITLLTDFGLADGYVGAMKGVIARLAPEATVVDISHAIPPQDLQRAGIVWAAAMPFFPPGAIHVGVVDPGVGTAREILAVEARGSVFLAPDNGLLGYVLSRREIRRSIRVRSSRFFLEPTSATFHGRDIFAPVAAHLARGVAIEDLGPAGRPRRWATLPVPRILRSAGGRSLRGRRGRGSRAGTGGRRGGKGGGARVLRERGEVIAVDAFGNVTTNLRPREGMRLARLEAGEIAIQGASRTYGDVAEGRPLALVGSSGYIEVAVNRGRAAERLGLEVGARVVASWRGSGKAPRKG